MKKRLALLISYLFVINSINAYDDAFEATKADSYTIDGQANEVFWANSEWYDLAYVYLPWGDNVAPTDFTGRFKLAWTEDVLLVLAEIEDDVFSDEYSDPFDNYWQDDCFEVFIDEDHSGGWHQDGDVAYNAFAYHISTLYDAVDIGKSGNVLLNDHVEVVITQKGNIYIWEIAIQIYDDTYDESGGNTPVTLTDNKEMGLTLAYCDNDGTGVRENFIGAVDVAEEHQNSAWQDADVFGTLTLAAGNPISIGNVESDVQEINVYPSHVDDYLFLDMTGIDEDRVNIQIVGLDGRILMNEYIEVENTMRQELYLGKLHEGPYIVRISGEKLNFTRLLYKD